MNNTQKKTIVLACSGASNTGAYSDMVARKLMSAGQAKMLCMARFAIDEKFAEKSKHELHDLGDDGELVIIDGCTINCAEKVMLHSGFQKYRHINTTDFGIEKGKTPVTEEKVNEILQALQGT